MKNLNKNLFWLLVTSVAMTGCTNLFLKSDKSCHFVIETTYSPPVVSNLDYALIKGFQNQAIIEPAFQHALTLPSRLQPVASIVATTRPVPSEHENGNINTVYFAFDSVTLSDAETAKLNHFIVKNAPLGILHIKVTGHTDSYGRTAYNQRLSLQRAQAVRQYLIAKGVKPSLISTLPLGEHEPAATNSTDSGRALNRRSELYPVTRN
ncbi:hypothetical protein JCM14076_32000 [Methylosoma difficile]